MGLINGAWDLLVPHALAVWATLWGSWWLEGRGELAAWVLARRPELVTRAFVHQLVVVSRRSGRRDVHWSAGVQLADGPVLRLPAGSEAEAHALVTAVLERCPGVSPG